MQQAIKSEWTKRLRSGDYKQGTMDLCSNGRFCCLGVLCEMAKEEGVVVSEDKVPCRTYRSTSDPHDASEVILPGAVQDWAGLGCSSPWVRSAGKMESLVALNDEGSTFDEIADLIDESL